MPLLEYLPPLARSQRLAAFSPERYLSASVREQIEQVYYGRVNQKAKLENLINNPLFLQNAAGHPAFYSDHGAVHVRDVAKQILRVSQTIIGVLIPQRSAQQMDLFLYGYGVALAYLHDIIVRGKQGISPESTFLFAEASGTSSEFWLNLQFNYDRIPAKY